MLHLFALAAAAVQAASPAPPSEAQIDRFIAVLPPAASGQQAGPDAFEQLEEAKLREANPGGEARLEPILRAHRQCSQDASKAMVDRMLRETATRMGSEKLERLTAFYDGPDYDRFSALLEKEKAGSQTAAEKAEFTQLTERYPLEEFARATQSAATNLFSSAAIVSFAACAEQREKALVAAGLEP